MRGNASIGAPSLVDEFWLFGEGTIFDIERTILFGIRTGLSKARDVTEMPAFGQRGLLTDAQIRNVVQYVLKLSGRPHLEEAATEGRRMFEGGDTGCVARHADGRGDAFVRRRGPYGQCLDVRRRRKVAVRYDLRSRTPRRMSRLVRSAHSRTDPGPGGLRLFEVTSGSLNVAPKATPATQSARRAGLTTALMGPPQRPLALLVAGAVLGLLAAAFGLFRPGRSGGSQRCHPDMLALVNGRGILLERFHHANRKRDFHALRGDHEGAAPVGPA